MYNYVVRNRGTDSSGNDEKGRRAGSPNRGVWGGLQPPLNFGEGGSTPSDLE